MHKKKKRDIYEYMGAGLPEYFEGKLVFVGRPKRVRVKIKKRKK